MTLSAASEQPVTVDFETVDFTATADGKDYKPAQGTLTFAPGEVAKTITVKVLGDASVEMTEEFALVLSNPLNAVFGKRFGDGTITNDD